MKFKSEIVTQASGSIGGTTYSHNRGGMYRRARSIPTNPNSAAQQTVRNNLAGLAQAWNNDVTTDQRDNWANYAELSPLTDAFGDPLTLTGQQMYIRCNSVRLRAGLSRVDTAPVATGLESLTTPVATISVAAGTISVAFTDTDAWANEVGGALAIQTGRLVNGSINFFDGPRRFLETVVGAASPPSSPETNTETAFGQAISTAIVGQKVPLRYVAMGADGRISAAATELVTVVA